MRSAETTEKKPMGTPRRARWIRPVKEPDVAEAAGVPRLEDGAVERFFLNAARSKVSGLVRIEREIEERIQTRCHQAEAELQERLVQAETELADRKDAAEVEACEKRIQSQKEGRIEGFREGFSKGTEEGRRLGFEQGRLKGIQEGAVVGRREEESRWKQEFSTTLGALAQSGREFQGMRDELLQETRTGVVRLAVEIAKKVIKREVLLCPEVILANVERAIDHIFRGCDVVLHLHPDDAEIVERTFKENPRWAEDLKEIEVRPSPDMDRGGCRLLSGAGVVDLTLESQLEQIEQCLLEAVSLPRLGSDEGQVERGIASR